MAGAKTQSDLFPGEGAAPGVSVINERCLLRTQDGHRVVLVSSIVLAQYAIGDAFAEANAMVSLVDQGYRVVPWSPVIPVEVVPIPAGGDTGRGIIRRSA